MKIEKGSCSIKVHRRELVSLKFMCYFITVVVLRKDIYRIKLTPMPYLLRIRIQAASDKYPQSRDSCARLAILNVVILFGLFIYFFILNGREIWSAFAFNFLIQSDIESKCLSCTCLSHEWDCVMTYRTQCSAIWRSAFSGYNLFSGSAECVWIIKHIFVELLKLEVVKLVSPDEGHQVLL